MYGCIIWEFYIVGGVEWLAPTWALAWVNSLQYCTR